MTLVSSQSNPKWKALFLLSGKPALKFTSQSHFSHYSKDPLCNTNMGPDGHTTPSEFLVIINDLRSHAGQQGKIAFRKRLVNRILPWILSSLLFQYTLRYRHNSSPNSTIPRYYCYDSGAEVSEQGLDTCGMLHNRTWHQKCHKFQIRHIHASAVLPCSNSGSLSRSTALFGHNSSFHLQDAELSLSRTYSVVWLRPRTCISIHLPSARRELCRLNFLNEPPLLPCSFLLFRSGIIPNL